MKKAGLLLLLILTGGTVCAQNKALGERFASRLFIGEKIEKAIVHFYHESQQIFNILDKS